MDINKKIQTNEYFMLRGVNYYEIEATPITNSLLKVLPTAKDSKILDIGCGLGNLLISLKKYGYNNVKGIDISTEAIEICKRLELNVEIIVDLVNYSLNCKEKYDFIIISHVLEHIRKELIIDTLLHIREYLLSDEGSLCIMVPNAQSNTGCYWAYEDFTHTTLFTSGSLSYVLKAAGFAKFTFLDTAWSGRFKFDTVSAEIFSFKVIYHQEQFLESGHFQLLSPAKPPNFHV